MNTPTTTPRTDAAWSATFDGQQMSAGKTARTLREHLQQLETELVRLRAELQKVYALVAPVGFDLPGGIFETAQAVSELFARAERAGDELATEREKSERYRLATLRLDAELAAERARLDWVFRNCKVFAADYTIHDREDLGATMKEDAK